MFYHMFKRDELLSVLLGRGFRFVLVFWFDSPKLQRFALCFVLLVLNAYLLFGPSGSMGNGFEIYKGYLYGMFGVVTVVELRFSRVMEVSLRMFGEFQRILELRRFLRGDFGG